MVFVFPPSESCRIVISSGGMWDLGFQGNILFLISVKNSTISISLSYYLEKPGQSGVPVRDVLRAAVHQGGDDVAEGGQGEVDLGGLLQSVPGRLSLALPLTASQVNQVEFSLKLSQ